MDQASARAIGIKRGGTGTAGRGERLRKGCSRSGKVNGHRHAGANNRAAPHWGAAPGSTATIAWKATARPAVSQFGAGLLPCVLRDGASRLLRMTFFLNAITNVRHPEEHPEGASRRTRSTDAAQAAEVTAAVRRRKLGFPTNLAEGSCNAEARPLPAPRPRRLRRILAAGAARRRRKLSGFVGADGVPC